MIDSALTADFLTDVDLVTRFTKVKVDDDHILIKV